MKWQMTVGPKGYDLVLYAENDTEGRVLELMSKKEELASFIHKGDAYSSYDRPSTFSLTICCRDPKPVTVPTPEESTP